MSGIPWFVRVRMKRLALREMARALGLKDAVRIGLRVDRAERAGEPWTDMPPPADEREAESRAQIGSAVILYRALQERLPKDDALALAHRVVTVSSRPLMDHMLGRLDPDALTELGDADRKAWVWQRTARFPNMSLRVDQATPETVAFTVTKCVFPGLCAAVGAPELAPAFCAVDSYYFGEVRQDVELTRPHTIATGGADCPFTLRWRGAPPGRGE